MIPGANQPEEVNKLKEFYNTRQPIPWVRIHKVADHVHFPHMRHINAGLQCQECHGEIQTIGVLEAPEPIWGKGKMGWCVNCHRDSNRDGVKGAKVDAPIDCIACHH